MEGCNATDKHNMMEYHTVTNYFCFSLGIKTLKQAAMKSSIHHFSKYTYVTQDNVSLVFHNQRLTHKFCSQRDAGLIRYNIKEHKIFVFHYYAPCQISHTNFTFLSQWSLNIYKKSRGKIFE